MFIVIPMFVQNLTMSLDYQSLPGNNPQLAIRICGLLLIAVALSIALINLVKRHKANSLNVLIENHFLIIDLEA